MNWHPIQGGGVRIFLVASPCHCIQRRDKFNSMLLLHFFHSVKLNDVTLVKVSLVQVTVFTTYYLQSWTKVLEQIGFLLRTRQM